MPVARQDLMRSVYRRYFTLPGKIFPKLVGARDLTREVLDEWHKLLPPVFRMPALFGVLPVRHDTAEVTMAAREILDSVVMDRNIPTRSSARYTR